MTNQDRPGAALHAGADDEAEAAGGTLGGSLDRRLGEFAMGPGGAIDFDILADLTSFYLRSVNIALSRDLDRSLGDLPVARGTGKISTLLLVDSNPGIRPSVIARLIQRDRSSMVRLLDQLKAAGLVVQRVSAAERRSHELFLTDRGRAMAQRVRRIAADQNAKFFEGLAPGELEDLNRVLAKVYARILDSDSDTGTAEPET